MAVALNCIFIFAARVIDVSMLTIRTLMVVRGKRLQAALIGFFEVIVYIVALNRVVNSLDNPFYLFCYALGFATGNYVGSVLEEKMAIGDITVQIIPKTNGENIQEALRANGFGVTAVEGMGKEGPKQILHVGLKRKMLPKLIETMDSLDEDAFMTIMDAKSLRGGYVKHEQKSR